ncbi:unnamed protein product [Cylicocyclus nassatus]|uniref:Uncharacterized protein n=1 Tax=Cylicocyclus nassatus TaxID=53992 RepID=A0AA36GQR5_CYLNA|nr:unnamed protein product [Cylicocyclus nassatus]CAJ0596582.1 unnamed protein product [Cylicocyclus nassatus]
MWPNDTKPLHDSIILMVGRGGAENEDTDNDRYSISVGAFTQVLNSSQASSPDLESRFELAFEGAPYTSLPLCLRCEILH